MKIELSGQIRWMAFGKNGMRFAIQDKNGVRVFDCPQLRTIFTLPDQVWSECEFSPNGRFLACGTYLWSSDFIKKVEHQLIDIWDIEAREIIGRVTLPHGSDTSISYCLKFSPDSAWLAIVREDGLVVATHLTTFEPTYLEQPRLRFFKSAPSCIFLRGTCVLAYTYLDEAIKVVELDSRRQIRNLKVDGEYKLIGYRQQDSKIFVARYGKDDYDNQLMLLDLDANTAVKLIGGAPGYRWSPSYPTLSPGSNYLAASVFKETSFLFFTKAIHSVDVWDASSGQLVSENITDKMTDRGLFHSVNSLAFAAENRLLIGKSGLIDEIGFKSLD